MIRPVVGAVVLFLLVALGNAVRDTPVDFHDLENRSPVVCHRYVWTVGRQRANGHASLHAPCARGRNYRNHDDG